MTRTAQPLVGRDHELHALERLLGDAREGASRFVIVSGEPGIGKTSVLDELARRAAADGWLVLQGGATELERDVPFGLFVDAFDAHLESLDAHSFDRLAAADELGELASVFPALRSLRPATGPLSTAAERFRAHHAARELIERLAARRPLLLTLDDVHWSDGASLELIGHLLRRTPDAAVLVAATIRSGQAPPALAAAVEAARRTGRLEQLSLGPLGPGDARRLVAGDGPADHDALYRESGGNPFYLLQLARAVAETAAESPEPGWTDAREVPAAIRAAITTELDALPQQVRAFAQAAAVVGDPFELDVAVATTAVPEPDALAALDELIARDVLRAGDAPRRFRFRHPLVRKAIYATCPPGTRLVAHERAAAALAARGAPPVSRAHHVAQSARHGDAAAVALLRAAGVAVSDRAPASAASWLEAALRILPASTPAAERVGLLTALAGAHAATGRFEDGRDALLAAMEHAADDLPTLVGLTSACAKVELVLGRGDDAQARLEAALERLGERAQAERAGLMMDLALNAFYATDYDRMHVSATGALEAARPLDDRPLLAGAIGIVALAEAATGRTSAAAEHCSEAAALIDAAPDAELAARPDGLAHLSAAEYLVDRFEECAEHAGRGLALGRATGRGDLFPATAQSLAGALFSTGRLAEAAALLDDVLEAARLTDNAVALAWALLNRAYTSLASGDVDAAMREAREAAALAQGQGVVAAWAGGILAAALLEAGEPEQAADLLVRAGGGPDLPLIPGGFRASFLEILTRACLAAGRHAEAERAATSALACAERFGLGLATAVAERAAAAVALDDGDAGPAAERALASALRADAAGARLEAGVSRTLAGRALAGAGETERAVAVLERAAAELDACGALRHRNGAERELRRLGRAVHRRSARGSREQGGLDSLTGRELEVARLVVDRRTNSEIAAELFLSVKTVETHLRNIFRKLDASSRVEVARIVEGAGAP